MHISPTNNQLPSISYKKIKLSRLLTEGELPHKQYSKYST